MAKSGAITRILKFLGKHPVATATVGGTAALAWPKAKNEAKRIEYEIRSNRMGSPHGKYVYAELDDFEARKQFASEKLAFVKAAGGEFQGAYPSVAGGFFGGVGTETAKSGIGAIGKLIKGIAGSIKNKMVFDKERQDLLGEIVENDPIVSVFEQETPGVTSKAYETMTRFAPTLSRDPNIATSFLREAAQTGGALNYQTVKHLADAEAAVNTALEG
jgi:hypothetical protein